MRSTRHSARDSAVLKADVRCHVGMRSWFKWSPESLNVRKSPPENNIDRLIAAPSPMSAAQCGLFSTWSVARTIGEQTATWPRQGGDFFLSCSSFAEAPSAQGRRSELLIQLSRQGELVAHYRAWSQVRPGAGWEEIGGCCTSVTLGRIGRGRRVL
jgi:hypothetical protein